MPGDAARCMSRSAYLLLNVANPLLNLVMCQVTWDEEEENGLKESTDWYATGYRE